MNEHLGVQLVVGYWLGMFMTAICAWLHFGPAISGIVFGIFISHWSLETLKGLVRK